MKNLLTENEQLLARQKANDFVKRLNIRRAVRWRVIGVPVCEILYLLFRGYI